MNIKCIIYNNSEYFCGSGKLCGVGLSMMCYTFGKEKRIVFGDLQLRGLIGKLLY